MKSISRNFRSSILLGTAISLLLAAQPGRAAENSREPSGERQRKLLAVLESDAPLAEKAITCKRLAIYGDKEAVPALARLLSDTNLASWARIALEVIPGAEADAALREALPKLDGNLLIGVINSIGARRDPKAVSLLAERLKSSDREVAAAAAVALGNIGGEEVAKILQGALAGARQEIRPAIAEGAILCAEQFLAAGRLAEATRLYDAVREAEVPRQRRLEATRGAILARQTAGLPLLLEALRSPDRAMFAIALRTARELPGREVSEALGAELDRAMPAQQVMLLLALADRGDAAVLPKLLQVARTGSKPVRVATVGLLDRFRDLSAVPVLLDAAAEADQDLSNAAKAALTRMEGEDVNVALMNQLLQASGKRRQAIIELAALRRIAAAVPAIVPSIEDPDPNVRQAALATLGVLGSEQQAVDLVRLLLKGDSSEDRDAAEQALTAICRRTGSRSLPHVLPLAKNNDGDLRRLALRVLASIGGSEALAAVKAALEDRDEAVRDEAVGTLATWPNNWPEDAGVAEPLLALAKSGTKSAHRVQGARGYLQYLQENRKLDDAGKISAIEDLLPHVWRPQEKRLAISTLSGIPTARSLELLTGFVEDPALAEEACLGLVTVATAKNLENVSTETRRKALQTARDRSKNESTRKKAADALEVLD